VIAMLRHARRKSPIAVVRSETVFSIVVRKSSISGYFDSRSFLLFNG
jgi:hypothetical protein